MRTVTSHLRGIVHTSAEGPRPQGTWTSIQCQVFEEHINDMISCCMHDLPDNYINFRFSH